MAIATPRDLPRGWLRTQQLHGTRGTVIKVIKGDADTGNHVVPIVGVGVSSIVVGGLLLMFVRRRRTALE
jgi:LPXTG-motif cell wall-anchored protein